MPRSAKPFKNPKRIYDGFSPCREYHKLYCTVTWEKLRESFLSSHPLCAECLKRGIHRLATVVDHVIPHKGDNDIFYDSGNLQSLCITHHNKKTYRENRT